jgi:hypothetical protein
MTAINQDKAHDSEPWTNTNKYNMRLTLLCVKHIWHSHLLSSYLSPYEVSMNNPFGRIQENQLKY